MKKVLLSTSAVALVAFAAPAQAAEWEVTIGGYAEMELAYGTTSIDADSSGIESNLIRDFTSESFEDFEDFEEDIDDFVDDVSSIIDDDPDVDGVGLHRDMEAVLTARITLDNGLQFGAQAEFELETTTTNNTDENEVFIQGAFGEIVLGNEDAAGERMALVAPDVGIIAANSGTMSEFIRYNATPGYTGSPFLTTSLNETFQSDATGITYFTPRIAGVQLGVSYFRTTDGGQDESLKNDLDDDALAHSVSFGANYVNSFGGVDVSVSGFYGFASNQLDGDFCDDVESEFGFVGDICNDPEIYGFGVNLGYAGFTLGGSWGEGNDLAAVNLINVESASLLDTFIGDGRGWDVGLAYETGPWAGSVTFFRGVATGYAIAPVLVVTDEGTFESEDLIGYKEELNLLNVSGTYTLAQGVTLVVEGGYADYENAIAESDGFFIGTGVDLSF